MKLTKTQASNPYAIGPYSSRGVEALGQRYASELTPTVVVVPSSPTAVACGLSSKLTNGWSD